MMPRAVLERIAGKWLPPVVSSVLTAARALPQILHRCWFAVPLAKLTALCFEMHLALLASLNSSVSTSSVFSLSLPACYGLSS